MTIIDNLVNRGILLYQDKTKKLAFDINEDKKVQENEIVPDVDRDGQISGKEVLDFIVNNVVSMPQINIIRETISDNAKTEKPNIQKIIEEVYVPLLIDQDNLLAEKVQVRLLADYENVKKEIKKAEALLLTAKVNVLEEKLDAIGIELAKLGYLIPLNDGYNYTPIGKLKCQYSDPKVIVGQIYIEEDSVIEDPLGNINVTAGEWVYFFTRTGRILWIDISDISNQKDLILNNGQRVIVESTKDATGHLFVSESNQIYTKLDNPYQGNDVKISGPDFISLKATANEVTLPNGTKIKASKIAIGWDGSVVAAELAEPADVELIDHRRVSLARNSLVFFTIQGMAYNHTNCFIYNKNVYGLGFGGCFISTTGENISVDQDTLLGLLKSDWKNRIPKSYRNNY